MKKYIIVAITLLALTSCTNATNELNTCIGVKNDIVLSKEFIPEHRYKGRVIPEEWVITTCRNNKKYEIAVTKYWYDIYNVNDQMDKNYWSNK